MERFTKQDELVHAYRKAGLSLKFDQDVPDGHSDVFWYGGTVATVDDGKGAYVTLIANGDVIGSLIDFAGGEKEIDSFKDKGNQGDRHDVERYIRNDKELHDAMDANLDGYRLDLYDGNCIEWFFDRGRGDGSGDIETDVLESVVDDDDDILTALSNVPWVKDVIREIHEAACGAA